MTNQEEQLIIKNVIAGDTHAFAGLVNTYKDMAVILAYNILLNQEDAEEVAQDAFVKAYSSLHSYQAASKFSTWLYRIIVNTALNKKKLKKYSILELPELFNEELPAAAGTLPATQVTGEQRKHIQHGLRSITENERLCITLYYLNELSVEEIHALTGISLSNIKVLLHRGRKNLYTSLRKHLKTEISDLI